MRGPRELGVLLEKEINKRSFIALRIELLIMPSHPPTAVSSDPQWR